jgi:L-rhamnose isomerase / sugar isomerase
VIVDTGAGAADPFQLFRIMREVEAADALAPSAGVRFMLDECHNIEPKIHGQIRSMMNVQQATAKALLVDSAALTAAQLAGCARCPRSPRSRTRSRSAILMDAYDTAAKIIADRVSGTQRRR